MFHAPHVRAGAGDLGGARYLGGMTVVATGSVAFDYILTFDGHFGDHILPDKRHIINLSFLVDRFQKRRGGVGANYAYNLRLLGQPVALLATIGGDGREYRAWLESLGVDCQGLLVLENEHTATGFTTTDLDGNQLTGYYGGAMNRAGLLSLSNTVAPPGAVLIGPSSPDSMLKLAGECRLRRVPWLFDPAHQLPRLTGPDLEQGARGAWILIGNDYEMQLVMDRTGRDVDGLLEWAEIVVTTLGREGSVIRTRQAELTIPVAPVVKEVDPVGAGDAYRAGLVTGLLRGLTFDQAGKVASLAAAYAVEQVGTIEHTYTLAEFAERHRAAFGIELPHRFLPEAAA